MAYAAFQNMVRSYEGWVEWGNQLPTVFHIYREANLTMPKAGQKLT